MSYLKRTISSILRRIILFRSHEFRITALDLLHPTNTLRNFVSPFSLYLDWRHDQIQRQGLEFYKTHPVLWDITENFYGKIDRISLVMSFLEASLGAVGDVAEFGVYRGHTATAIQHTLKTHGSDKQIYLFDSFAGMPKITHPLDSAWEMGDLSSGMEHVNALGLDVGKVHLVPGYFHDTLKDHEELRFAFCHVDCDLYTSIKECIDFLLPRMSEGGTIIFDDYGFRNCPGAKQAIEESLGQECRSFIPLPTGQAAYIARPWNNGGAFKPPKTQSGMAPTI